MLLVDDHKGRSVIVLNSITSAKMPGNFKLLRVPSSHKTRRTSQLHLRHPNHLPIHLPIILHNSIQSIIDLPKLLLAMESGIEFFGFVAALCLSVVCGVFLLQSAH